ncbi:MAG: hypothetical protein ACREUD_00460 [Gammaproteobacteria bacterium]
MVWLILGIVLGLYLGAKFNAKLMPIVTTIDSWIETAKKIIMKQGGEEKPQL